MILETIFSLALFITSGNLIDTKFGLHKYSEQDYREIFYLKNNKSTSKECIRHSELEDIKKIRHQRHRNGENTTVTDYKVTKNKEKDSLQETSEEKITS